ncbi:PGDYG domain-containing protein [Spiroplasma sp. AdecLV25b]|uniref:PGDYG domain-containing protein n=1 Tax=Spiroplasma sp. AdecLV25b TaxID=3027162 RepID=UPI0027E11E9A|nr:PGDYG domain-containing protein [Spiroplasma sp. AdecLV25b]
MICMKNPYILVKAEKQAVGGKVKTLEGEATYNAGDFIVTGIANEQWVVKPNINNESVPKGYILVNTDENIFRPSGNVFKTCEIANQAGEIKVSWDSTGNTILKYDAGDYLIKHDEDDIAPCKKEIFGKTYVVGDSEKEIIDKLLNFKFKEIQKMNEKIAIDGNPNIAKPINW